MTPSPPSDATAPSPPDAPVTRRRPLRRVPLALATVSLVAVVLLVVVALLAVRVAHGSTGTGPPPTPLAPAGAATQATTVPAAVLNTVGAPGPPLVTAPVHLSSSSDELRSAGRPLIVYVGAEYCPFCAAQRWALVVALSRFGTFTHLGMATSSSQLVFPGLASFSFHGASYRSRYVSFEPIETYGSDTTSSSDAFVPLQPLTGQVHALMQRLDVPPLAPVAGTLPFVDIAGRYIAIGAGFSPGLLSGRSLTSIASALSTPSSSVGRAVDGAANEIAAAICTVTGGQPGGVCRSPAVAAAHQRAG